MEEVYDRLPREVWDGTERVGLRGEADDANWIGDFIIRYLS